MKNIILTGFMGTGKSSVGRHLAEGLGLGFVDTDDLIEGRAGLTVSEIFERFGEGRFRALEKEVIQGISTQCGLVIATGGGAILDGENLSNLKRCGVVICLTASPDTILSRIGEGDERPLLVGGDIRERISGLLKLREPFYMKADFTVDTTAKGVREVVEEILKIVR